MSNWNSALPIRSPTSPLSPISPTDLPPPRPSLNRLRSAPSHRRRRSSTIGREETLIDKLRSYQDQALTIWNNASPKQQLLFLLGCVLCAAVGITFLILSPKLLAAIGPIAESWRALPGGWLILFFAISLCAFPPVIGYSTCLTIAGIVWGLKGWFICASATVFGSTLSFIASRTILSRYVHSLVGQDKRFTAFALTLKHDGIKILIMIRLCPLPYSLSNAALSTFPTVNVLHFIAATAAATPKLLIHVFVGSRLAAIAENDGKMDLGTKIFNYISILAFGILGAAIGYIIYQKTVARARQIEEEEAAALAEDTPLAEREGYFEDADVGGEDGWGDDDVSLWDNDEPNVGQGGYRDDWGEDAEESGKGAKPISTALLDEEAAMQSPGGAWGHTSGR